MTRRFKHWAYLNDEGRDMFGDAFPNGRVPVRSMIPTRGRLGDHREPFYLVEWEELTDTQKETVIATVCESLGAHPDDVKKQIADIGLPLRESLTNGSGTDHPGFFF